MYNNQMAAVQTSISLDIGFMATGNEPQVLGMRNLEIGCRCNLHILCEILFVGQQLQTWQLCESLRLHATILAHTEYVTKY
jgi:hypothetical protein